MAVSGGGNVTPPAPAPASPSAIAWPNPNAAGAPPDIGTPSGQAANPGAETVAANGPTPATAQPQTAAAAASGDLPAGAPIAGPVPLPRHRPLQFAMIQGAMAQTAIPLPRPRPADAPAATPTSPSDQPQSGYVPDMEPGHY